MAMHGTALDLDMDAIIEEVARRHKILLTQDDPVLVTATLNRIIIASLLSDTNKSLDDLLIRLEEMYYRQAEESKVIGKKLINASLNAANDSIAKSVNSSGIELLASIKRQLDLFTAQCDQIAEKNKQTQNITIVFGSLAFISALAVAGILFFGM